MRRGRRESALGEEARPRAHERRFGGEVVADRASIDHLLSGDGGGELEIAREPVEWKVARLQHPGEPAHLRPQVQALVGGEDGPVQDVLVVVDAPCNAGDAVAPLFVWILGSIATADFAREREEVDGAPARNLRLDRRRPPARRRELAAQSATTS